MLTKAAKQSIDFGIPSMVGAIAALMLFKRYKRAEVWLVGAVIAFVLSYVIISRLTNMWYLSGPAPVPTGGGCDSFDPAPLGDAIHEDLTCWACFRKEELYDQLLTLADCQLITLYNYYSKKFTKSLAKATAEPGTWTSLSGTFTNLQQPQLAARFAKLQLQ